MPKAKKKKTGRKPKAPRTNRRTVQATFTTYLQNGGDGSAVPRYFATEKEAERAAAKDDERYGDDIVTHTFHVDAITGEIVLGLETKEDAEDDETDLEDVS